MQLSRWVELYRIICLLMHKGKHITKITKFMVCSAMIQYCVLPPLYFCEGDGLFFFLMIFQLFLLFCGLSFWAALIPSSFTFSSVYRHSREYSVSQQCICFPSCTEEETVHYDLFSKVCVFDHVTRSKCSSHILLWCYVNDLICPRREKQVVNHLVVLCVYM